MTKVVMVVIADESGTVLDRHKIDIAALDRSIRRALAGRGDTAAARVLLRAGDEVADSLSHEIAAAWVRYCEAAGTTPPRIPR